MWLWFALGVVLARGYQRPNFHRSNDTGRVRERTIRRKPPCEIVSGHCPPAAFLSCSGKKGSKEAGLRGEQLAPARIVPPLRIPRVEPSEIDPSLWLGVVIACPCPRLGLWVLGLLCSHAVD